MLYLNLEYRTRLPVREGHSLYVIMDETNTLQEGEVCMDAVDFSKSGLPADMSRIPYGNDLCLPDS